MLPKEKNYITNSVAWVASNVGFHNLHDVISEILAAIRIVGVPFRGVDGDQGQGWGRYWPTLLRLMVGDLDNGLGPTFVVTLLEGTIIAIKRNI